MDIMVGAKTNALNAVPNPGIVDTKGAIVTTAFDLAMAVVVVTVTGTCND
jgi:hypothetical protein